MSRDEIVSTVDRVLVDEFELEPNQVTPDASLFQDLGLDSLDAVDLIVALEAAFGGRVPEEQARQVRSVEDIYGLIETSLQPE